MQGFSKALLDQHFKLYRGYVNNVNLLQNQLHTLVEQKKERSTEFADLKRHFGWEFDGMRLHELYFENLGGNGQLPTSGALKTAIEEQFGSLEAWKEAFIATGMMRGIGWVILYADVERGRLFNAWIDEHAEGHLATAKPLIVMDVWEHAYITEYGLNREGYIEAFFKNLDWNSVEKRFH
ncbi:MAG: superoxide dismutase [Chlamydiia bacterium]|nr:superoxide dismutase [Chlamydiia bacterium]